MSENPPAFQEAVKPPAGSKILVICCLLYFILWVVSHESTFQCTKSSCIQSTQEDVLMITENHYFLCSHKLLQRDMGFAATPDVVLHMSPIALIINHKNCCCFVCVCVCVVFFFKCWFKKYFNTVSFILVVC